MINKYRMFFNFKDYNGERRIDAQDLIKFLKDTEFQIVSIDDVIIDDEHSLEYWMRDDCSSSPKYIKFYQDRLEILKSGKEKGFNIGIQKSFSDHYSDDGDIGIVMDINNDLRIVEEDFIVLGESNH